MSRLIGPRNTITIEETMSTLKGDFDRHMADWNRPQSDKARMLRGAENAADCALNIIPLRQRDWPREAQFRRMRALVYRLQNRVRKAEADTARAEEVEKMIKEREEAGEALVKNVVGNSLNRFPSTESPEAHKVSLTELRITSVQREAKVFKEACRSKKRLTIPEIVHPFIKMAPSTTLNSPEGLAETLRLMKSEAKMLKDRAMPYPNGQESKILLLFKAAAILQDCLNFIVDHRPQLGKEEALCRDQRDSLLQYIRKEVEQSNIIYDQPRPEPSKPAKLKKKCKAGEH